MIRWPDATALTAGLALAGAGVAGYLTVVHYRDDLLACTVGGCTTVQQSRYAEVGGVPVAALGLTMYLTVLLLCVVHQRWPAQAASTTVIAFSVALAGALYAAYLTYVEVAVIDAICQWCVLSALLTWAMLIVVATRVWGLARSDAWDAEESSAPEVFHGMATGEMDDHLIPVRPIGQR